MSLDIYFTSRSDVVCPHCGKIVTTEDVYSTFSSGRKWYEVLEQLGYYVPYDKRTEEKDWYGKDMVLTNEQTKQVYDFIKKNSDLYNAKDILGLISTAVLDKDAVVINANW